MADHSTLRIRSPKPDIIEEYDNEVKKNIYPMAMMMAILTIFFVFIAALSRDYRFLYLAVLTLLLSQGYCIGICNLSKSEDDE